MAYKIGNKIKAKKTGETFLIVEKNKKGYVVSDDYTEFYFPKEEFKKEFKK